jgi:hypothetical protein
MEYDSRMRRVALSFFAIILLACGASASSTNGPTPITGERYPIHLTRAFRVGQRAHVTSVTSIREQTVTTFHGQVVDTADATTAYDFDGIVEYLSVDADGRPVSLRYDVRSFTRRQGQLPAELLRPGQVLELTRGETLEASHIVVDAAPISEELRGALDDVLPLTLGTSEDDALFGSTTPRAIGERWPANVVELARGLTRNSPLRFDPSHVRGEAQIVERAERGGVDGLEIAVVIDADQLQVDGLASGASLREGRFSLRVDGFFPIDESLPRLTQSLELRADLAMSMATPQGAADVALTMTRTGLRTTEPL